MGYWYFEIPTQSPALLRVHVYTNDLQKRKLSGAVEGRKRAEERITNIIETSCVQYGL